MEIEKFVLSPFYECMDAIIPLTQLKLTNIIPDIKPGRFISNQLIEFSLQLNHSFLLSESKKYKSKKFDIRAIIRFGIVENENKIDEQFALKDNFPLHLKLNLNNTIITLPQFLPNDRFGKDGRRFPRPVDLSEGLLENPLVINKFLMQWIQDDCKKETYYFAIYLVRRRTCEELTCILLNKQLSPSIQTLNFILKQSKSLNNGQDDDLMLVNSTVNTSLICPVSRIRMKTPVRGQKCTHLQCFDCVTYLIMNFHKPTWQCPVCNKTTLFCYLEVDNLILTILQDTRSISVENIIFNKNGQWKPDKKLPGVLTDDNCYYDVDNFNINDSSDNVKTNIPSMCENFTENRAEKYLQQIPLTPSFRQFLSSDNLNNVLSRLPNNIISNQNILPDPFKIRANQTCNQLYNVNRTFQDHFARQISTVPSLENLLNLRLKMGVKPVNSLNEFACNNRMSLEKLQQKPIENDRSPQIKITNVTSVIKNSRETKVIVISDDENDDADNDDDIPLSSTSRESIVKTVNRAQKRPVTVSTLIPNVEPVKSLKFSDNYMNSYLNMRLKATSAPTVLDSQRQECCCTSNNMCALHRGYLLRNGIGISDKHASVKEKSNLMKSQEVFHPLPTNSIGFHNFPKSFPNQNNRLLEYMKLNAPQLVSKNLQDFSAYNCNNVKEPVQQNKSLVNPFNNSNIIKLVGSHPEVVSVATRQNSHADYFQSQWLSMMNSQPHSIPKNTLHQSTQFKMSNPVSQKIVNSFTNQSNAFYHC